MHPNQDVSIATEDERKEVVRTILEQDRFSKGTENRAAALPCTRPYAQQPKNHTAQATCPSLDQFCLRFL